MDHSEFANKVLAKFRDQPAEIPAFATEETRRNNAARCMAQLLCNRLSTNGHNPERIKHATYRWMDGVFALQKGIEDTARRGSKNFWKTWGVVCKVF